MMFFKVQHNKIKNGFIFAEVVMTIALIGFLLTALLSLQAHVFKRVIINAFRLESFYPIKNMLITDVMQKDQKSIQKQDEAFKLKMKYEKKEINPASSLYRFKGLYQKQAVGTWFENDKEKIQVLISYGFEMIDEKNK